MAMFWTISAIQEDADLSVDALARYLRLVHETVTTGERPMKLHIIAHSMGTPRNRAGFGPSE